MYDVRGMDTPLFGDTRPRVSVWPPPGRFVSGTNGSLVGTLMTMDDVADRYLNYVIAGFTSVLVLFTFISSLLKPWPPDAQNVFLAISIIFVCLGELVLIFWYRRGDLDPKFRQLIYYNCFTLVLLCICANVFYYKKET